MADGGRSLPGHKFLTLVFGGQGSAVLVCQACGVQGQGPGSVRVEKLQRTGKIHGFSAGLLGKFSETTENNFCWAKVGLGGGLRFVQVAKLGKFLVGIGWSWLFCGITLVRPWFPSLTHSPSSVTQKHKV